MGSDLKRLRRRTLCCMLALGLVLVVPALPDAQERGNPEGEWRYQSGDAWGTRYSSLDQIDASNFGDLEVQWIWRGANFSPHPLYLSRSDAELYRRRSVHCGGLSAHGRRDRPCDR